MNGYALHPEAFTDLDDIAAYIGQESASAALRLVDEIYRTNEGVVSFPERGFVGPT